MTGVIATLGYRLHHASDTFLLVVYLVITAAAVVIGFSEEVNGATRRRRRQREARRIARAEARREREPTLPRAVVYRDTREIER